MCDTALTAILLGILPLIFYRPHVGLLVWAWIAFMNLAQGGVFISSGRKPECGDRDHSDSVTDFIKREVVATPESDNRCDAHVCGMDHRDDLYGAGL